MYHPGTGDPDRHRLLALALFLNAAQAQIPGAQFLLVIS